MDRAQETDLIIDGGAAASLPPAMIGETGWDVLLALIAKEQAGLSLEKLASLVSVPGTVLQHWLDWLEDRQLVVSGRYKVTNQLGAAITRGGRELVQNYLLATSSLRHRGVK